MMMKYTDLLEIYTNYGFSWYHHEPRLSVNLYTEFMRNLLDTRINDLLNEHPSQVFFILEETRFMIERLSEYSGIPVCVLIGDVIRRCK